MAPTRRGRTGRTNHRSSDSIREDVILPMKQPYMSEIVSGLKTHEFRTYRLSNNVKRIWFYITAPECRISHICEINPTRTRTSKDKPLPLDGLGNKLFNERHPDWDGYGYVYEIKSVYELREPLTLAMLREQYGLKGAPRGMRYVTPEMIIAVPLEDQVRICVNTKEEQ
jgi:predicted transcriptional regulator